MKTNVIRTDMPESLEAGVKQAVDVIKSGGLVAFPTETVYGLAATADIPEAIARLDQVKRRPSDKPYTLHIGQKSDLARYIPNLNLLDRQLIRKAWPGPCTFVFELNEKQMTDVRNRLPEHQIKLLYYKNSIGVRLPDHPAAQSFLIVTGVPVVAPSANRSGEAPPFTAQDVLDQLDGDIELVLDGGTTRYARSSTVVKLAGGELEILRAGVLDEDSIRRMRKLSLLFVCTGNTCRSPMAEGLCRLELARQAGCTIDQLADKGYRVVSAGVMGYAGAPVSANAISACKEKGVDISNHIAQPVTPELINASDAIFVMDQSHFHAVVNLVSGAEFKTKKLDMPHDIADPIGMPLKTYQRCGDQIARAIKARLEEI